MSLIIKASPTGTASKAVSVPSLSGSTRSISAGAAASLVGPVPLSNDTASSKQRSSSHQATDSVVGSFDDEGAADAKPPPKLGFKDELEVRFIWDRVLGRGRHGTLVRAVVDRFTGVEYACKRMPKKAPLPQSDASAEARKAADDAQIAHIRREITLFTQLRSSLNVAKLEQVYEDADHVYIVMEKCSGPTLTEHMAKGEHTEQDVSNYMRSVVKSIALCHDAGEAHGAVSTDKFMLLSEERSARVKATGFGAVHDAATDKTTGSGSIFTMAPEMLSSQTRSIGKNADTWAAGLMAARLLTGYFPFDDIVENLVDSVGVLPHVGPLAQMLDDNPLMPSGAALFVSATVMLLDFTRPNWQPITNQGKDWVLKCLNLDEKKRWSPMEALNHPWLARFRGEPKATQQPLKSPLSNGASGVVQRIQRFGAFSELKRTALEHIAGQVLHQSEAAKKARSAASNAVNAVPELTIKEPAMARVIEEPDELEVLATPLPTQRSTDSVFQTPPATAGATSRSGVHDDVQPGASSYYGLLEHIMLSDGTVNRMSLASGLRALGYSVSDSDLDRLLDHLSAVPGLGGTPAVPREALAASQLQWEQMADEDSEDWLAMARRAFDALDLDGDGEVHRSEMEVILAGRCPEQEIERAIQQSMRDSGQAPDAQSLDFRAFMRLLKADIGPETGEATIQKYASMRMSSARNSLAGGSSPRQCISDVLRGMCTFRLRNGMRLMSAQLCKMSEGSNMLPAVDSVGGSTGGLRGAHTESLLAGVAEEGPMAEGCDDGAEGSGAATPSGTSGPDWGRGVAKLSDELAKLRPGMLLRAVEPLVGAAAPQVDNSLPLAPGGAGGAGGGGGHVGVAGGWHDDEDRPGVRGRADWRGVKGANSTLGGKQSLGSTLSVEVNSMHMSVNSSLRHVLSGGDGSSNLSKKLEFAGANA